MTDPRDRIELPGGPHYSLEPTAPHERAVARYLRGQYIALRHFSPAEFGEDWPRMSVALLARLDLFRERLGSPVIISPAPGALGRQLGASDTSQHNIDRWGGGNTNVRTLEDGGKTSSASAASSSSRRRTTNTKKRKGKDEAASSASVGESDLDAKVSKIVADERTNRLFLVATARSYRRVKSLIAKLDVPIPGDGQVHIHQLNHAKAADLASVLSNLSQEQRSRTGNSSSSRTRRAGTATTSSSAPPAWASVRPCT